MQPRPSTVWRQLFCAVISLQFINFERCFAQSDYIQHNLEARQSPALVSTTSFLRRGYQASTVAGSWLYIDGGAYSFISNQNFSVNYATSILSIDLSQDWVNSSVEIKSTPKPSGAPNLNNPSLWYYEAEDLLYSGFGGAPSLYTDKKQTLPKPSLWKFALDDKGGGTWTEAISPGDSKWSIFDQVSPNEAFQAFGPADAYILGGNDQNQEVSLPGYIQFDMDLLRFINGSAAPFDGLGGAQRGSLIRIDSFGTSGIYIAMGGMFANSKAGLLSFEYVSVFDPSQQRWYNQSTTGTPPAGRIQFCIAGVNSTNQTYEIFVYAGWGTNLGQDAVQYDTISILTLPAFHWIQVPYTAANPRHGHSCNAVGGSQIISVGGVDSNSNDTNSGDYSTFTTSPDPFTQGLAIFDMTALQWATKYTANAPPYEQSEQVKQFYSSDNGAYLQNLSSKVKPLMAQKNFASPPPTSANESPANASNPSSSPMITPTLVPSPASTNVGAIVGGVIGGLLFLGALTAAAIFLISRRRRAARLGRHSQAQYQPTPLPLDDDKDNEHKGYYHPDSVALQQAPYDHQKLDMQGFPVEAPAEHGVAELQDRDGIRMAWEAPATEHVPSSRGSQQDFGHGHGSGQRGGGGGGGDIVELS